MTLRTAFRGVTASVVLGATVLLGGCGEKLTEENYDRISNGMSLSEVEGIIGGGTREDSGGYGMTSAGIPTGNDSGSSKQQTYTWEEDGKRVVIVFNNGKVMSKSKTGW